MNRRDLILAGGSALALAGGRTAWAAPSSGVLKFGQSASLSGGQAAYGKDVRDGILAAFAAASTKGLKLELITLDDGGDKEKCKANTQALIESGVLGLVGYTSGAAAEASATLIEDSRTVLLGAASGNMGIRNDKLHMQYHVRAGYDLEYQQMVRYVKDFGMRRVGYVYLKDTSAANLDAMTAALDKVGVKLTASVGLNRNNTDFSSVAKTMLDAKVDCVLFTTNAAPISGVVEHMSTGGYLGMYFSSSFAGQTLLDAMAQRKQSVVMAQVVPRPNALGLPLIARCHKDMAALAGSPRVGFTGIEGYIVGSVAAEAARQAFKAGPGMSKARFHEAVAALRADLGGYSVDFSGGKTQGSKFVDVVAIDRAGRVIG
jgi:ABC-type branched-subunit amino acid transport system substrate-binding protein